MYLGKLGLCSVQVPVSGGAFRGVRACSQVIMAAAESGNRQLTIFSPEEVIMSVIEIRF